MFKTSSISNFKYINYNKFILPVSYTPETGTKASTLATHRYLFGYISNYNAKHNNNNHQFVNLTTSIYHNNNNTNINNKNNYRQQHPEFRHEYYNTPIGNGDNHAIKIRNQSSSPLFVNPASAGRVLGGNGGSGGNRRTFYTINNIDSSVDMNVILGKPRSADDVYQYMRELFNISPYCESIRIPFLSMDRDLKDIKGIKLYGRKEEKSWIVIVGGKEPDQWTSISATLYLGAMFSNQPLDNIDVLIFPIQNPIPYTGNANLPLEPHLRLQTSKTASAVEIGQSGLSSSRSFGSKSSPSSSSGSSYKDSSQSFPILNNDDKPSNQQRKPSVVFNDWLKRSKRKFENLEVQISKKNGEPYILNSCSTLRKLSVTETEMWDGRKQHLTNMDINQNGSGMDQGGMMVNDGYVEIPDSMDVSPISSIMNPSKLQQKQQAMLFGLNMPPIRNNQQSNYIIEIPNIPLSSDDQLLKYSQKIMSEIRLFAKTKINNQ